MSAFLKALSKVGLVELAEAEIHRPSRHDGARVSGADAAADAILLDVPTPLESSSSPAGPHEPGRAATGSAVAGGERAVAELAALSRSFDEIYASAGVSSSPYPAEKMLRVLDGLKAMDPATRKAAVTAMDAADEDWSIQDPVTDAQRKIKALMSHKETVIQMVGAAESQAKHDLAAHDQYQHQATATIREEIAKLEQRLAEELARVAGEKADVSARLTNIRHASAQELSRLDHEILRLRELPAIFVNHDSRTKNEGA